MEWKLCFSPETGSRKYFLRHQNKFWTFSYCVGYQQTTFHNNGVSESKSVEPHPNNFPFPTEYEESEEYETEEDYDEGDLNGANIPNSNGIFCMYKNLFQNQFILLKFYFCFSFFATHNYVEGDGNWNLGLHCG